MRGVVVVVLAVGACRARPPEPLQQEAEVEHDEVVGGQPQPREPVLAPRPELDVSHLVPDPTHELRWPLSMASHPELEPQFAIAAALAEPGVGWTDLCRLGAHHSHPAGERPCGHRARTTGPASSAREQRVRMRWGSWPRHAAVTGVAMSGLASRTPDRALFGPRARTADPA